MLPYILCLCSLQKTCFIRTVLILRTLTQVTLQVLSSFRDYVSKFYFSFLKIIKIFPFFDNPKNALTEHVKLFYLDKKKLGSVSWSYWLYTRVKFLYMLLRGSALRYYKWLINFLLIMKLKVRKNTKIPRFALGKTHYSLIMKLVYVS